MEGSRPSVEQSLGEPMAYVEGGFAPIIQQPSEHQIASFIDSCLYDEVYDGENQFEEIRNPKIVHYILEQSLVIEDLPPKTIPIQPLL